MWWMSLSVSIFGFKPILIDCRYGMIVAALFCKIGSHHIAYAPAFQGWDSRYKPRCLACCSVDHIAWPLAQASPTVGFWLPLPDSCGLRFSLSVWHNKSLSLLICYPRPTTIIPQKDLHPPFQWKWPLNASKWTLGVISIELVFLSKSFQGHGWFLRLCFNVLKFILKQF